VKPDVRETVKISPQYTVASFAPRRGRVPIRHGRLSDHAGDHAGGRAGAGRRIILLGLSTLITLITLLFTLPGCAATQSPRATTGSTSDIQSGRYDEARRRLRRFAVDRDSPDVILDNLRLGIAAIHDGAFFEAKQALMRAYPWLVTGTVNQKNAEDTVFWGSEGQLVWKGEPFEQAAAWYYEALVPMIEGDWENTRAAAKNMLFTLVDFAGAADVRDAMRQAESPEWFDARAEDVESDLVLGYLLLGISEHWQARYAEAEEAFDQAEDLRPDLAGLISRLRDGDYNTLLVVEAQRGPRKVLHGRYGEFFTFEPRPHGPPDPLVVTDETGESLEYLPERMDAVDFHALAQHPRWWSLRSLRETKKAVGEFLTIAGTGAIIYGSVSDDANTRDKALLAGIAAALFGQAVAQSSEADRRYLDVLPRTVYLVPLDLEPGAHALRLSLPEDGLDAVRHFIRPGYETPAVYVVRLDERDLGGGGGDEGALEQLRRPIAHPNDVTGPRVGTYPYILGGTCVNTPTEEVLAAYQAGGYLTDWSLQDLLDLYREEGIVFSPLPASSETTDTYHHILRNGRLLYTPVPGSRGFEDLTYRQAPPYEPRSEYLKRVREDFDRGIDPERPEN